ncbi:MAG: HDOD domain-containing protein [Phycisphaerales bacterium]|nr:HDOD domain-containing protein [Phycisphaerales bacterium]
MKGSRAQQSDQARRAEMVLARLDALPTLSAVAVRVLNLSGSGEGGAREIVPLIESDPALTARLLRMCRMSNTGLGSKITTVERAVVLLGLDAVRTALLSVEVMELYSVSGDDAGDEGFDPQELWRRSIAVACASEALARTVKGVDPGEAFVAGLLQNLGMLALYRVVTASFARMVGVARRSLSDMASVSARTVGMDHRTMGKRLAEQWGLPHAIQDVVMFAGQSGGNLPEVSHRRLISVVTVGGEIARRAHIGFDGDFSQLDALSMICRSHDMDPDKAQEVLSTLHDRVAERSGMLGLHDAGNESALLMQALADANARLGELHHAASRRAAAADRGRRILDTINEYYTESAGRRHWASAIEGVARSAASVFDGCDCAVCWPDADGRWESALFDRSRCGQQQAIEAATDHELLHDAGAWASVGRMDAGLSASICKGLGEAGMAHVARLLPLRAPWGLVGVIALSGDPASQGFSDAMIEPLASVWGASLASVRQHEGAKRFGEQLAQAMRESARMQASLIESESLVRLGRMAAGAAHEMNNPLAAISGRAQILARRLEGTEGGEAARSIIDASEKLSDLIQGLHVFACPPEVYRERIDASTLVARAVRMARRRAELAGVSEGAQEVRLRVDRAVPPLSVDPDQLSDAISELISNALQSNARDRIEVRVHVDPSDDRLIVTVSDDGIGMTPETLASAFDPFFSAREAGRGTGLGLSKARRLVEMHGGELTLESTEGRGTVARVSLGDWRWEAERDESPDREAA